MSFIANSEKEALTLSRFYKNWHKNVVVFTNGLSLSSKAKKGLTAQSINWEEGTVLQINDVVDKVSNHPSFY